MPVAMPMTLPPTKNTIRKSRIGARTRFQKGAGVPGPVICTIAPWRSDLAALGHQLGKLLVLGLVDRIAVIVVGEGALFDLLHILLDAGYRNLGQLGKALGEFRLEVGEHAEQVVAEQDLPVRADACANADGRNG